MLAGHMDEIGFIIHHVGDDGLLYFKGIGGHDSVIPVGQRVWIHGRERVPGIIGRKAIHLTASAGIAAYAGGLFESPDQFEKRARSALLLSQSWGGNRCTIWEPDRESSKT